MDFWTTAEAPPAAQTHTKSIIFNFDKTVSLDPSVAKQHNCGSRVPWAIYHMLCALTGATTLKGGAVLGAVKQRKLGAFSVTWIPCSTVWPRCLILESPSIFRPVGEWANKQGKDTLGQELPLDSENFQKKLMKSDMFCRGGMASHALTWFNLTWVCLMWFNSLNHLSGQFLMRDFKCILWPFVFVISKSGFVLIHTFTISTLYFEKPCLFWEGFQVPHGCCSKSPFGWGRGGLDPVLTVKMKCQNLPP